jgi:hypothetical protein
MKSRSKELNVDSIGSQITPMTLHEQQAISNFLKQLKTKQAKSAKSKSAKLIKHHA